MKIIRCISSPGDELTVTLDALGGKKIEMTGQGAGNNRYYHGDGANWGYSLYRIDRRKIVFEGLL